MQKKVLIVGAKGMLGQELAKAFAKDPLYAVTEWDQEEMDVTDTADAEGKITALSPDIIINASAYNAVDACEESDEEYAKALGLNSEAPASLAKIAKGARAVFVHYSSDYVFGDAVAAEGGFLEDSEPKPSCRYAESKLFGEQGITAVGGNYYIIRLSKLFGKPAVSAIGKKSFFEVMLEAGKNKDEVSVVDDEMSCFTYAPDLAEASKALMESEDAYGVYHLINESPVTWYGGVVELYRQVGLVTKVIAVTSDAFPRPAKRPHFSVLKNTRRPLLRPYQEAMSDFLKRV